MYKPGDRVVIRKDLIVGEYYGGWEWRSNKNYLKELGYVVIDLLVDGHYVVENGRYITDEMISCKYEKEEDNMKYQKGDKVVIRKDLKAGEVYGKDGWVSEMERLLDTPYVTISLVLSEGYYEIENTNYKVTDEMISHKYGESEPKYVWHCKDKNSTYVLTNEGFFKVSSDSTYEKILNGDFSSYLLTEEEAKKTIFYPILKKHTPPPKEKLYYVCISGSVGNMYLNLFLEDDTYYFGSKDESPRHRTKFTEEEADKIIGTSTVLCKEEVE